MPRKVLFYTHAFNGGGAETVFARLATAFASAGDDVVFAADHEGPIPIEDRPNLQHVRLGASHLGTVRRLADLLRRERPDASFSALGGQNLKHLAAAFLSGRMSRCVLGYHGFAEAEPRPLARLSFWATPMSTRLAARTICVSDALLENVRRHWRGSRHKTLRIYNSVGSSTGTPQAPAPTSQLILACGRLAPIKRFTDLVQAFARVTPATASLVILGEGSERSAIEAEAARCGVANRLAMPGYVQDVAPYYRRAACLAITSESESFGLTAVEALSHGVPVVSTDCAGPPEILEYGRYGRIVPVGDIDALANALTETLAAPGPATERRARADAFSIDAIHRAYAELIDSLA